MSVSGPFEVGEKVPDFALYDASAAPRQLSDLASDGQVVLVFYRGYW